MNPLKQGLKLGEIIEKGGGLFAFIHESIKTRVETSSCSYILTRQLLHLSMNPLKQGLKQQCTTGAGEGGFGHLSMNPLKQGLKPLVNQFFPSHCCRIYP